MDGKELNYARETIDSEGFDYAFMHYSDFPEIKDRKFHRLREAYVKAANALEEYIYGDK